MRVKSDIEIAQECEMEPIQDVAKRLGIEEDYIENYGKYKAKIDYNLLKKKAGEPDGKLVLVTAITPTTGRRRKDNHFRRTGRRDEPDWKEGGCCIERAVHGTGIRN
jgi:hypothetical protein